MKKMPAAAFKSQCLAVMDSVCATGEGITVTKRGRPVVHVTPAAQDTKPFLGRLQGLFEVKGKITDPAIPPEDWDLD